MAGVQHADIDHTGLTGVGGANSLATDTLWDAAGDLVVGSGANTAAKLSIGAAGGHVSRINGVVAWNSGTSNPGAAATGDRYWRTDVGLEVYYDGTRWVTTQLHTTQLASLNGVSASGAVSVGVAALEVDYDVWLVKLYASTFAASLSGSAYWTISLTKYDGSTPTTGIGSLSNISGSSSVYERRGTAIGALLGTAMDGLEVVYGKTSTPGNLTAGVTLAYRLVVP